MSKSVYWDIRPILSKKPDVAIVVGQRSNGKTYGTLRYFLQNHDKGKFVYLRRWKDDVKVFNSEQLFEPLQAEVEAIFGEGYCVKYDKRKYYLVNPSGVKISVLGYLMTLSEASHSKSVPYTNVRYILFDEFIQMAGEPVMRDEKKRFETVINTITRDRTNIQIICVANTVSKFSWLFVYYGIDINKVNQGDIVTVNIPTDDDKVFLRVACEYCEYNEVIGKKASKYVTSQMVKSGKWEIPPVDDIPTVKNEVVKDRLLFTVYDHESDITIGCFLRSAKWEVIKQQKETLLYYKETHRREFLVLKTVSFKSNYFHLTNQKTLDYHTYNDLNMFLKDIEEGTGISFEEQLYRGRVYSDNCFTADYFNHCWIMYGRVNVRAML